MTEFPHNTKFEFALLIIVIILCILTFITENIFKIWLTIFIPGLFTFIIWRLLQKWGREKKDNIPGRMFEYLFFFFLFLSSYAITFIASFSDKPERIFDNILMNILFIPSIISAMYSGWLHYIEGIHGKDYLKPKSERKFKKKGR